MTFIRFQLLKATAHGISENQLLNQVSISIQIIHVICLAYSHDRVLPRKQRTPVNPGSQLQTPDTRSHASPWAHPQDLRHSLP